MGKIVFSSFAFSRARLRRLCRRRVLVVVVVFVGNLINCRPYEARLKSESKVVAPQSEYKPPPTATHYVVVHSNYAFEITA